MDEKIFNVVLELTVRAIDPLDAAEKADALAKDLFEEYSYVVQNDEDTSVIYYVDLYDKRVLGTDDCIQQISSKEHTPLITV